MDVRYIGWAGYELKVCDATSSGIGGYGSIQLEYGWQLVAIPIVNGYWDRVEHKHIHDDMTVSRFQNYVLEQIEDLYGVDLVEVANTYPGDLQAFLSYVPGSTPHTSPHNFQLVYDDGLSKEISGFWIKIKGMGAPYTITWGEH